MDILINGHDHDKQHIICKGVHLIISGTGCQIRPVEKDRRNYQNLKFYEETLGYCLLQISRNKRIKYTEEGLKLSSSGNNRVDTMYSVHRTFFRFI